MKNPAFIILCILLLAYACTNTSEKANDTREITTPLNSPNIDSLFKQTMEIEAHEADYDQIEASIKAAGKQQFCQKLSKRLECKADK